MRLVGTIGFVVVMVLGWQLALAGDADATEQGEEEEACVYPDCPRPELSGGGLKDPPAEGERPRGAYSSICQTPVYWCVIGPGYVGQSCYCNTPYGIRYGVVTQ